MPRFLGIGQSMISSPYSATVWTGASISVVDRSAIMRWFAERTTTFRLYY